MGLIYLDSCLLIYAVERDPLYGERVLEAIESHADARLAISPLVELECLVKPIRSANLVLQRYYEDVFEQLELLPLDETVFLAAAQLRARFGLRTPDALHLACAQLGRCDALWTNDSRLADASQGLALGILV